MLAVKVTAAAAAAVAIMPAGRWFEVIYAAYLY